MGPQASLGSNKPRMPGVQPRATLTHCLCAGEHGDQGLQLLNGPGAPNLDAVSALKQPLEVAQLIGETAKAALDIGVLRIKRRQVAVSSASQVSRWAPG